MSTGIPNRVISSARNRLHQGAQRRALHEKNIHAGLAGFLPCGLIIVHGEGNHPARRPTALDTAGSSVTIQDRHLQVEQDHMRPERLGQADRFRTIRCLAHDFEVAGKRQQGPQFLPHLRDCHPRSGSADLPPSPPLRVRFHPTDAESA